MSPVSNRARIIQDLVSLEAWHSPFEIDCNSPFHVAVSFSDARFSGDETSPIEFRVQLKRATLVVIGEESIQVPKRTKVREYPKRDMQYRTKDFSELAENSADEENANAGGSVGATNIKLDAGAGTKYSNSEATKDTFEQEFSERITQNIHMVYQEVGIQHRWNLEPISGDTLKGIAHDGAQPIMELRPKALSRLEDLGIRVFLKCKADDFEITDIEAKPNIKERVLGEDLLRRERMAKVVIKQKLLEAELEVVELEPKFKEVIIADILAVPE